MGRSPLLAVASACVLVLASVAGAAEPVTLSVEGSTFTASPCTAENGETGCLSEANVKFSVSAPQGSGGNVASCAYNGDGQVAKWTTYWGEVKTGQRPPVKGLGKGSIPHCNMGPDISQPESGYGTGVYAAQALAIYGDDTCSLCFATSNIVHFTVTDECRLTVARGFARKPPQETFRVGEPFPCDFQPDENAVDHLKLRSTFGDALDLHGCGYLVRIARPGYIYAELRLRGRSPSPEGACSRNRRLRPGRLTVTTGARGLGRYPFGISAQWGVVFLPNAPTTIAITYGESSTTLRVIRGSAVLGTRHPAEKRGGPVLFGAERIPDTCRPVTGRCVLHAFLTQYRGSTLGETLVRAGQSSTAVRGHAPTHPR